MRCRGCGRDPRAADRRHQARASGRRAPRGSAVPTRPNEGPGGRAAPSAWSRGNTRVGTRPEGPPGGNRRRRAPPPETSGPSGRSLVTAVHEYESRARRVRIGELETSVQRTDCEALGETIRNGRPPDRLPVPGRGRPPKRALHLLQGLRASGRGQLHAGGGRQTAAGLWRLTGKGRRAGLGRPPFRVLDNGCYVKRELDRIFARPYAHRQSCVS